MVRMQLIALVAACGAVMMAGARVDPPMGPELPSEIRMSAAQVIGKAHNERAWRAHVAFTCDINVTFGGTTMLQGSMLLDIAGGRVRYDLQDGTTLIWDGEHAWVSPADSKFEAAPFHLFTWPYLLTAPFRLSEPGAVTEEMPSATIGERVCNTLKLTFDEKSTHATPRDWFMVYSDLVTHTVYGMAYISTYDKTIEAAEREPSIVIFEDPAIVNSIVFARTWSFYAWDQTQGKHGPRTGEVKLANLAFAQLRESAFVKPDGAREAEVPKSGASEKKADEPVE